MEQKIEGNKLELNLVIKGEKTKIFANKVVYLDNLLVFYLDGKESIEINLTKKYKTIYEALKSVGINIEGY